MRRSCGEQFELLRERRLLSAGVFCLSFSHHVNHLDPTQDYPRGRHRLEPEHRPHSPLDGTMVLLDAIIEVGTLPDPDRLQLASRPILEPTCRSAGQNGFPVGLAAVDDDPLRTAVVLQRLAQEPFGGREIAPLTEPELDRVAIAVDGAI